MAAAADMTDSLPLVSVCIANYNGMALIDDCLHSVLEQEGDVAVEILVHDDASSDGSVTHIRDLYPSVKLIASQKNVGFCVANNRMVVEAKGKYILLLNNDAALYPNAIQTLLSEASRLDRPAILGLPQYDATTGELIDIGSMFDPFLNPIPNHKPDQDNVGMVIGACLWIPRTLWYELEGFPEWFGSIAEDMYLCCRARLTGHPVRALRTSGYRHWQGKSFGGNRITNNGLFTTIRRRALSERNKSFVMVLIYPAPLLQIIFPLHIILLAMEGIILSLIKRDIALFQNIYLCCVKSLWRERTRLFHCRRKIQETKSIRLNVFWSVFHPIPHKLRMLLRYGFPHLK